MAKVQIEITGIEGNTVSGTADGLAFTAAPFRWGSKMLMKISSPGEFTQGQKVAIGGACKKALAKAEVALPKAELVRPRKPKVQVEGDPAPEVPEA